METVSQRYVTVFIYLSVFFFYLTALLIPLTEGDSCKNGHSDSTFFYYNIYAVMSAVFELVMILYLQRRVDDGEILQVNKFHLVKIVTGQLGRADFFTDVLFVTQIYWCDYDALLAVGVLCLFFSSFYQLIMFFKLMRKDEKQLLENIERNCKLAYISEHHALAVILDSFSLSNFQAVGEKTITVPKIMSSIKSLVEDLPQFLIQVVYILVYSDSKSNQTGVVISILLGLFSFGMSVNSALHAKTSSVDIPRVEKKILQRIEVKHGEFLTWQRLDHEAVLAKMRRGILDSKQVIAKRLKEQKAPEGYA